MTFDDFLKTVNELFPNSIIDRNLNGEFVIITGLELDHNGEVNPMYNNLVK